MTIRQDVLSTKQQARDALRKVRRVNVRMYHDLSADWHKASVALIDGGLDEAEELYIDIVMDAHAAIEDALEDARVGTGQ
ncbi:hypothetical protein LCGC14_0455720 [marine sediment metagenome]|uniref:Uncharacterized protein n=1 Tax=marine sediment metagenome TaxID=412755 RepID=A0A0F9V3C5_9ZZZZ